MKIKAILLTIVLILSLIFNISCSNDREYDELEVMAAAEKLIKISEKLNYIYYGEGIKYEINESEANGAYYRADAFSLDEIGINTVDDIKELTYSAYSNELSSAVIGTKLTSVSDDSGIQGYARYYQKYNSLDGTPECIMVYKYAEAYLTDEVEYLYSTLRALGSEEEEVLLEIDVLVTNSEGEEQTQTLKFSMIEEAEGWRLNSPTYVKFVDRDYYEDLQNKK